MATMTHKPQVLVVKDKVLEDYLRNLYSASYELVGTSTLDEALNALEGYVFDVIVVDLMLSDSVEQGAQVIQTVRRLDKSIAVIVVGEASQAVRAIQDLGAWDFLLAPLDFAECRMKIHRAIEERRYRLTAIEAAHFGGSVLIHSPYIVGSPLGVGNVMFYGQEEIFDFIRNNIGKYPNHNHLTLIGPRRIGKTSILQQLSQQLPATEFVPVNINCQALGIDLGMPAFFLKLISQITRSLRQQQLDTSILPMMTTTELQNGYAPPALQFTERFLPSVYHVLQGRSLILCLDEFEELVDKVQRQRLDISVFDFLYEIMTQEKRIILMLAGTRRLTTLSEVYPGAALIVASTLHRQVTPLAPPLTRRLIEEPVAYSGMYYQEAALDVIQTATGGYPYLVQLVCNSLVNLRNDRQKNEITVTDVQKVLAALVETARPGFFWESLTSYQKIVLLAVVRLYSEHITITAMRVEGQLQYMGVNLLSWPPDIQVAGILSELSFEGLLCAQDDTKNHVTYTLTFELSKEWVRRHKSLDLVLMENKTATSSNPHTDLVDDDLHQWVEPRENKAITNPNPYTNLGRPVRTFKDFYGRKSALIKITDDIRNGQCVSVVGPRRIGKTSLLLQMLHPEARTTYHLTDEITCVYFTPDPTSPGQIYAEIVRKIYQRLQQTEILTLIQPPGETMSYRVFEETISTIQSAGIRLVLLMDDFEIMAHNSQLSFDFFLGLRALHTEYDLTYVTASLTSMMELSFSQAEILSSPFVNIFDTIRLEPFLKSEVQEFIKAAQAFSPEVEDFLVDLTGGHPLALQHACHLAFARQQETGQPLTPEDQFYVWRQVKRTLKSVKLITASESDLRIDNFFAWTRQRTFYKQVQYFFNEAGYELQELENNTFLLSPNKQADFLRHHSTLYLRLFIEQPPTGEDFSDIARVVGEHYGTDLTHSVAIAISDQRPVPGARYRLYEIRQQSGLAIVLLDSTLFAQVKPDRSANDILNSAIDQAIGRQDLYALSTPVSDDLSFFGRERVLQDLVDMLDAGQMVGLFGLRKIGKTSLVQRLQGQLVRRRAIVVIDTQSTAREQGVWPLYPIIVGAFAMEVQRLRPGVALSSLRLYPMPTDITSEVASAFLTDLQILHMALDWSDVRGRLLLIIDEVDRLLPSGDKPGYAGLSTLLGQLRAINQQLRTIDILLVGVDPTLNRVERWIMPDASYDNELYRVLHEIWVPPMDTDNVQEMIESLGSQMGVRYTSEALTALVIAGGGQPFVTRQLCSCAVAGRLGRGVIEVTEGEVQVAIRKFVFHDPYLKELWRSRLDEIQRTMLRLLAEAENPLTDAQLLPPAQRQTALDALGALEDYTLVRESNAGYTIGWPVLRQWIRQVELGLRD